MSAAAPATGTADHGVILFDGVCNLCNGFVQWVIRRDPHGRFRFAALQSHAAQQLVAGHPVRPTDMETVLYVRDGRVRERSTAVLHIMKDIGGLWRLMFVFMVLPRFIRNGIYTWVARNRYKWRGKRESCMIPTPELRERFIDG